MRTLALAALLAAPASAMRIVECGDRKFVEKTATLIVYGQVSQVLPKEDTSDGIATYVLVKVVSVEKSASRSEKTAKRVMIKVRGGVVGERGVAVSETASFKVGEKGYFYLTRPDDPFFEGRYYDPVCGWGATKPAPPEPELPPKGGKGAK